MKRNISLLVVFASMFVLGAMPNAQAKHDQGCSNATRVGEYVFHGFGNQMVDGVNQPIVLIGHLTFDGNGTFVGRGTNVLNGVTGHRTFTGTYTVEPNCHGAFDGYTTEGEHFYGESEEMDSDGEETISIRTVPGQTIIIRLKRSKPHHGDDED